MGALGCLTSAPWAPPSWEPLGFQLTGSILLSQRWHEHFYWLESQAFRRLVAGSGGRGEIRDAGEGDHWSP